MANQNDSSPLRKRAITAAAVAGAFIGAAGIAGAAVNATSAPSLQSSVASTATDSATTDSTATDSTATDSTVTDSTDTDTDTDSDTDRADRVSTEEALTGDLLDQVTAAALEAVPGGTIDRVETDDGGAAYEAHMTDADGNDVIVTFDENVALIAVTEGGGRGGHGDGGGRGGHGGGGSEEALTGDLLDQATTAALAAVPGGTIDRVETDSGDATYEAHMTDADGNEVTVTFDENMAVIEVLEGR